MPLVLEGHVELGAVTQWLSGGTPSRSVEAYWQGEIPWISASTLRKVEVTQSDQCVTPEAVVTGSKMAPIGSTLLLVRGSALHKEIRTGIVRTPVCFNQDVKALIPSKQLYPEYLTYSLLGREGELLKLVSSAGNTAGVLDTKLVQSFRVWLPSFDEQRAIATALSDVDALLEELDRLIAKKRDLKQAAMQQLLTGQTRLPGFEGEWEQTVLDELVTFLSGGTPSRGNDTYWAGDIPWISASSLRTFHIWRSESNVTEDAVVAGSRMAPIGATLLLVRGSALHNEILAGLVKKQVCFNQDVKALVPKKRLLPKFLTFLLLGRANELLNLVSSAGNTAGVLDTKILKAFDVHLPSLREQQAIADALTDLDDELEALEQRRTKTAALKQATMQELLTGKTRLVDPAVQDQPAEKAQPSGRKANIYFMRSVLAAEIVDQLHAEPTFGHVKFEKMLFLVEHLCDVDTGSTYHRKAAGPYDNRALRSIDSQLQKQQWFEARKEDGRYRYVPLNRRGNHKTYFVRYFAAVSDTFEQVLDSFRHMDTERCEIVATLFAAWRDLLHDQPTVSDEMIVHEVLNNWHESKQRIPEDRWLKALAWMRERGFAPEGRRYE
ncbi:restriction endonuclease subunit S [Salinisphaera sp.]|uniref:restriction endonuclease subunit S n=1 Tax=Salinisphaera sp. TaxID=1914330 RepID=UPI0025D069C8|nr:restriction endonuclease subunit S [Salinisphaera sp.]